MKEIMIFQAEELMRKIEKEEEQVAYEDPEKKIYHLCIVNLVIGYVWVSTNCSTDSVLSVWSQGTWKQDV